MPAEVVVPVGLEVRVAAIAVLVEFVLVRVDDLESAFATQLLHDPEERKRREFVVVVEQRDVVACSQFER